jgi:hypothetical protein
MKHFSTTRDEFACACFTVFQISNIWEAIVQETVFPEKSLNTVNRLVYIF